MAHDAYSLLVYLQLDELKVGFLPWFSLRSCTTEVRVYLPWFWTPDASSCLARDTARYFDTFSGSCDVNSRLDQFAAAVGRRTHCIIGLETLDEFALRRLDYYLDYYSGVLYFVLPMPVLVNCFPYHRAFHYIICNQY